MADTIVNTPTRDSDGSAGWAVAVIILLAIIAGGAYYFLRHRAVVQAPAQPAANIQVNVPVPTNDTNNPAQ